MMRYRTDARPGRRVHVRHTAFDGRGSEVTLLVKSAGHRA